MKMSANRYLLVIAAGIMLIFAPVLISLQSVEYITIQTSSPVTEGDVCSISVQIKSEVGVSGTAYLFIDEVFYTAIGGSAGSDGIMYFITGWNAVGVGNHVLRISYFEDGYPTEPFEKSVVITVLPADDTIPDDTIPDDTVPDIPDDIIPDAPSTVFASFTVLQVIGFAIAGFGTFKFVAERKKKRK